MERESFDRRTVLRGAGGVLVAGALAGCTGGSGNNGGGGGSGGDGDGSGSETEASGGETDTGEGTESGGTTAGTANGGGGSTDSDTGTGGGGGAGGASAKVEQHLADAKGYDGSIADRTGKDSVKVAVGAGDAGYAFEPAAVRVSPGTTVRWEWTGEGGAHNVVSEEGTFDSGQPQTGSDVTYEKSLDQPGTYLYHCEPHESLGMKGAVVVADSK